MRYNKNTNESLEAFNNLVHLRYKIYNSVFLTLNLGQVHQTGILLPILFDLCKEGYAAGKDPSKIIEEFLESQKEVKSESDSMSLLFRMIQYIERQVVLIDALEDAAYAEVNDINGKGSYSELLQKVRSLGMDAELNEALSDFKVRIVMTAHPTQFYPGNVLGIITDLTKAVQKNNIERIRLLLLQLGKTPFFKKRKPTPYDEAVSLGWYLENIFYDTIGMIHEGIVESVGTNASSALKNQSWTEIGFWPGGDRDGNPFVNVQTTIMVADRLRNSILKCYYRDIRKLKRRLTFSDVEDKLIVLEHAIHQSVIHPMEQPKISLEELTDGLEKIKQTLKDQHNGLFIERVESLLYKVKVFGYHFANLDIRQDSSEIEKALQTISSHHPEIFVDGFLDLMEKEITNRLFQISEPISIPETEDAIVTDTFAVFPVIKQIQEKNGERGAHRFIISNCQGTIHVAAVFALAKMTGWTSNLDFDIVPLFETIDDLKKADQVMLSLYKHEVYLQHLKHRKMRQVIMLGFSDGTKDGGYLSANWEIYQAKERITKVSRSSGVDVVFFDGRGGPPARGGGNTHNFYASLGNEIENKEIQLTIQGQTISSKFGTIESARHNIEQLLTAGLENKLFNDEERQLTKKERSLIDELSGQSLEVYKAFKEDDLFIRYLEEMSPLHYYSMANIGSRPSKRGTSKKLSLQNLRAIPFVGSWSQLKQNVPGFYGIGSVLKQKETEGRLKDVSDLYQRSLFFRTLIENSMQALCKTNFELTEYMADNPVFGDFWKGIYSEYKDSVRLISSISGQIELMERNPSIRESIKLREDVVLPLLTIQQYALRKVRLLEKEGADENLINSYRKMVVRSLFGNINASRNSA